MHVDGISIAGLGASLLMPFLYPLIQRFLTSHVRSLKEWRYRKLRVRVEMLLPETPANHFAYALQFGLCLFAEYISAVLGLLILALAIAYVAYRPDKQSVVLHYLIFLPLCAALGISGGLYRLFRRLRQFCTPEEREKMRATLNKLAEELGNGADTSQAAASSGRSSSL